MFFMMFMATSFQLFIMYFSIIIPSWKCVDNGTICILNSTLPNDDYRRCNMPRNEWDYTEPKEFSLATQFDIDCDKRWLLSLVTSIFFIGWGIGAIVFGFLGDRFGRTKIIFPSLSVILGVGFISSFIPNIYLII